MTDATATADPDIDALMALTQDEIDQLDPALQGEVLEARALLEEQRKKDTEDRSARVRGLGEMVVGLYNERRQARTQLEERWHADIRRYNGQYDPAVLKALQNREYGSQMYVPLARRVVNIVEARLMDLLFPTEERNWAIDPSPVPMLVRAETLANQLPPNQMVPMGPDGVLAPASAVVNAIKEIREEARSKADNMQREVDDQLRQANYGAVARRVIHEAMVMGTGVMKGPMVLNRTKKVWNILPDGTGKVELIEDLSPTVTDVSLWDFFPDMSAFTLRGSESEIERHYQTKSQLAKLARQPGFDAQAIARALSVEPAHAPDTNRDAMREASGTQGIRDKRYMLLEYHGPVEEQLLRDVGVEVPENPLMVYEAVLWVLEDGTVIKAVIEPMDTQERPYGVFCWEKDPGCIFGFGLCHEIADLVEVSNSAFRAALDNLGLSVGPQIVVNEKVIKPENGKWVIEPNKIWKMIKADADARAAFAFFQIDSRLSELLGVFDRSKQMIDDIAGPVMAMQGQEAPSYLDTARGASIAHNAANIWMRRAVRNWDDDMTSPLVGRFVDWNMQYSPKADIKGDHQVLARGTSALLEAEGQQQKMGMFLAAAKDIPMPFKRRINQLRALARSMRLDPVDLLPDDAEVMKLAEKIDNQPAPLDPALERVKLRQAELADKNAERQFMMDMENFRVKVRMAEIASREGLTREAAEQKYGIEMLKVKALIEDAREQRMHDSQMLNAELAAKMTVGSGV